MTEQEKQVEQENQNVKFLRLSCFEKVSKLSCNKGGDVSLEELIEQTESLLEYLNKK